MAPDRTSRNGGFSLPTKRNSALATAAMASAALLSQTGSASADEGPSRDEVSRRVTNLYDRAETDSGTYNATRAAGTASSTRGRTASATGGGRGDGGDPALDDIARQWYGAARAKVGPMVEAVLPSDRVATRRAEPRRQRPTDAPTAREPKPAEQSLPELTAKPVLALAAAPEPAPAAALTAAQAQSPAWAPETAPPDLTDTGGFPTVGSAQLAIGVPEYTPQLVTGVPEYTPQLTAGIPEYTPRPDSAIPTHTPAQADRGFPEYTAQVGTGYPEYIPQPQAATGFPEYTGQLGTALPEFTALPEYPAHTATDFPAYSGRLGTGLPEYTAQPTTGFPEYAAQATAGFPEYSAQPTPGHPEYSALTAPLAAVVASPPVDIAQPFPTAPTTPTTPAVTQSIPAISAVTQSIPAISAVTQSIPAISAIPSPRTPEPDWQTPQPTAAPAAAPLALAPAPDLPVADPGYDSKVIQVLAFARSQIGKPCVWGAAGPGSYDNSGLVQAAWKVAGVSLPRTCLGQASTGTAVPLYAMQPGDLVFFHDDFSHVGLCTGNGMMIHAPGPGASIREESIYPTGESIIRGAIRPA
ncbi:NlpC/P60 family protein [Streptomyces sp. NPDC005303]|uniref:NlpC/P60 family protein n=1 Tax=Streptomyces sp. NPDC005303 TaxID=3155713 RepID=UPI0033AFB797